MAQTAGVAQRIDGRLVADDNTSHGFLKLGGPTQQTDQLQPLAPPHQAAP
jgi:hypothetical protein